MFVGCERELAQLHTFLDRAVGGCGQVAFVVGEAGTGKSALLQEFARRARLTINQSPNIEVENGNSSYILNELGSCDPGKFSHRRGA